LIGTRDSSSLHASAPKVRKGQYNLRGTALLGFLVGNLGRVPSLQRRNACCRFVRRLSSNCRRWLGTLCRSGNLAARSARGLASSARERLPAVRAVRCDFPVALQRRGRATCRADVTVAAQAASAWRSVRWREGSKGWLHGRFVALRCWRVRPDGKRRAGWLIGEQPGGNTQAERQYHGSNFRPRARLETLVGYAHRRHGGRNTTKKPRSCWAGTSIRGGRGRASTGTRWR
jgi:hypothetical protein